MAASDPALADPDSADSTAEATSTFTASHYDQALRTWLYDEGRDRVVEAPHGTLAACCIAWWDPAVRCAEIKPPGIVPEHRRRGLAAAMCIEVIAQVEALGEIRYSSTPVRDPITRRQLRRA